MKIFLVSILALALIPGAAISAAGQTPQAPAGNVENGRKLWGQYGCYECHAWEGQGGYGGPRVAPNPIPWAAFIRYVRAPAGVMPAYTEKLLKSEQDLADIYAYMIARPAAVPVSALPK